VFGGKVTFGRIVHGDDYITQKVKVPALKRDVAMKVLSRWIAA
jgi:hypothetical protein